MYASIVAEQIKKRRERAAVGFSADIWERDQGGQSLKKPKGKPITELTSGERRANQTLTSNPSGCRSV